MMADLIQVNTMLRKLNISYCDYEVMDISDSYKQNTAIQEFRISWNNDQIYVSFLLYVIDIAGALKYCR